MIILAVFLNVAFMLICLAFEYSYEKSLWNSGTCKKCGSHWAYVGGTAYGCKCKTYHFTFDWDQFRKFKYSK